MLNLSARFCRKVVPGEKLWRRYFPAGTAMSDAKAVAGEMQWRFYRWRGTTQKGGDNAPATWGVAKRPQTTPGEERESRLQCAAQRPDKRNACGSRRGKSLTHSEGGMLHGCILQRAQMGMVGVTRGPSHRGELSCSGGAHGWYFSLLWPVLSARPWPFLL